MALHELVWIIHAVQREQHRQNDGTQVMLPRLRYYLARGQAPAERRQTERLLAFEWVYVQHVLGRRPADLCPWRN